MRSSLFALALTPIVLAGCSFGFGGTGGDAVVMCPADVQTCADGSTVSRDPAADCAFAACPVTSSSTSDMPTITTAELQALPLTCDGTGQTACPTTGDTVVKMTTSQGDVWLRLFAAETPKTYENFTGLIERGYYDGIIFHRVIPDFMIQGGDPTGTGTGGASIWGQDFADEFTPELKNIRGALAMANRGPGTNGSQFFIVQAAQGTPWLDGRHTVFGQVIAGMDIVDVIAASPRDAMDKPRADIAMTKVEAFTVID